MIENQMLNYREPRMPYNQYQDWQKRSRQRPVKESDKPCIKPVGMGGRFDAKA